MSDPAVDEQDHKATSVEPVEAVKDSGPVPVFTGLSDDEIQKLGMKKDVDGSEQAYNDKEKDDKEKKEESLKQCEMIYINGGTDLVYWKSKFTEDAGISSRYGLFGMPYNRHTTKKDSYKTENITLKGFDPLKCPDGLRPHIHKVKNPDDSSAFLYEGKKYTQEDLVKLFNPDSVKNRDFFRYALQCMEVENQTVYEPYIIEKDNHLYFPENTKDIYADSSKDLQSIYANNLRIGEVNQKFIQEGRDLLSKYPKQLAIYLIIPAQVVVNVLGVEDFLYTLEIISRKDTGKSFAVKTSMHHFEGLTVFFKNDTLSSNFRNPKISSETNLSFYLEEADLYSRFKRIMKSIGEVLRGRKDQSLIRYKPGFSAILSGNSTDEDPDQDEQKAIDKRFLQIFLDKQDVVPENERIIGKKYVKRMMRENGGLLFTKILKKYTISELENKYYELDAKYQNRLELLLHYGEFLTDIKYEFPIDFGKKEEENWLLVFFEWAKSVSQPMYKQRNIKYDLRIDYGYNGDNNVPLEIVFTDALFQIFKSEHRELPFKRLLDFKKKYSEYIKSDAFSINGVVNGKSTKIVCDKKFYSIIPNIEDLFAD